MTNELDQRLDREAEAGQNYINRMAEAAANPNAEAPFYTLSLNPVETLTLYGALQTYHRALAAQDDLPQVERIVALMKTIRPAAAEASKLFATQGGQ